MAVSVRDVAAAASVSVGTVSNVLNRPEKVAPDTVARVMAAIDELGFVRNDAARQLRAGRSRSIGLVVLDVRNPFFTDVARGAEDRAAEDNMTILLGNSDENTDRGRHAFHRGGGDLVGTVQHVRDRAHRHGCRGRDVPHAHCHRIPSSITARR